MISVQRGYRADPYTRSQLGQIDYGGVLLSLAATVLLLLPLNWGGTAFPWSSSTVIGCLVGAVVGFFLFFLWEGRIARIPIIPAYIFCVQTVAAIFFNTFTSGSTILVQLFYLPQLLQIAFGLSAIRSGVLVIPLLVMTTFMVCAGTSSQPVRLADALWDRYSSAVSYWHVPASTRR